MFQLLLFPFLQNILICSSQNSVKRVGEDATVKATNFSHTESTYKGVNSKMSHNHNMWQRPESPTVTLTWHVCKYRVHKLHQRFVLKSDVPLVEFMRLVFTCMPGESYRRRLGSLLCLCDVVQALINSLVCWFCTCALGLVLFPIFNTQASCSYLDRCFSFFCPFPFKIRLCWKTFTVLSGTPRLAGSVKHPLCCLECQD